jgi:hypothetical protein
MEQMNRSRDWKTQGDPMKRFNAFVLALLLLSSLWPQVTVAQAPPPILPPNTVYGRLGAGQSGPGQAIPFATLTTQLFPAIVRSGRIISTSGVTMYVNGSASGTATCGPAGVSTCAAGVDVGNCSTPATACLTLQYAYRLMIANYDFSYLYSGTIWLAHNTGTTNYDIAAANGPFIGTSVIGIVGDSSNDGATVIQDPNSGSGVACKDLCTLSFSHVTFADSVSSNAGSHVSVGGTGNAGHVDLGNVVLGPMAAGAMLSTGALGHIVATAPLTFNGGAANALQATNGGVIDFSGLTMTISGTPAFSSSFAFMINGGSIIATPSTFSGTATGTRCQIDGPLNLGGYNPNAIFPGNADCVQNEYIGAIGLQTGSGGSSSFGYGSAGQPLLSGGGANAKDTWGTLGVGGGGTGQTTIPGIQSIVAPGLIYYIVTGVNFNSGTTDTAIPLTNFPAGMTRLEFSNAFISNASHTLVTATISLCTSTGGAGVCIAADQGISVNTSSDATNNNSMPLTLTNATTTSFVLANLPHTPNVYVRIGTPEGAAATADVTLIIRPLP